jgi:hypothetical protein
MARATWPLQHGRPRIQIGLVIVSKGLQSPRDLVADSGAGSLQSPFELILSERDCLSGGGRIITTVRLGGAYSGPYPLYSVRIQLAQLGFNQKLQVVGVPSAPSGFDGLAGFRFLNRFAYGNFGDPGQFGLEI